MAPACRTRHSKNVFARTESEIENLTKDVTKFLKFDKKTADKFCSLSKNVFDSLSADEKVSELHSAKESLDELIIEEFDDEQIWQELELRNQPLLDIAPAIAAVGSKMNLDFGVFVDDDDENVEDDEGDEDVGEGSEEEQELMGDLDEEGEEDVVQEKEITSKETKSLVKPIMKKAAVDDIFFKLGSLEEFLDIEDHKEERRLRKQRKDADSESEDDDDSIDLFADIASDEEGRDAKYNDFFDGIEEGEAGQIEDDCGPRRKADRKSVHFEDEVGDDGEDDEDGDYDFRDAEDGDIEEDETEAALKTTKDLFKDSDDDEEEDGDKSAFEKNQQKLQQKIERIEESRLAEKNWQMRGEITSKSRPENSLMEEHLDFDHQTRQAPQITQTLTERLEGWILQRVRDKAWDDVIRKVKPVEEVYEFRRRITLDQEKSKTGLADIYEQEYLKKKDGEVEKENPEREEIKSMMTKLFMQLDALSNYHFMPRPLQPELKIVKNLPAISVEEVTPATVSDEMMLAPEEIKRKLKRDVMAKEERSKTDRQRERRLKKVHQRKKQKFQMEKEQRLAEKDPKFKERLERKTARENLKNSANTKVLKTPKERDGALKSSTKFFERLQTQVTNQIATKKDVAKKRDEKKVRIGTLKL